MTTLTLKAKKLGAGAWPPLTPPGATPIRYRLFIHEFVGKAPKQNLKVKACDYWVYVLCECKE